jgi:hypothetical protein
MCLDPAASYFASLCIDRVNGVVAAATNTRDLGLGCARSGRQGRREWRTTSLDKWAVEPSTSVRAAPHCWGERFSAWFQPVRSDRIPRSATRSESPVNGRRKIAEQAGYLAGGEIMRIPKCDEVYCASIGVKGLLETRDGAGRNGRGTLPVLRQNYSSRAAIGAWRCQAVNGAKTRGGGRRLTGSSARRDIAWGPQSSDGSVH